jgi:hypothetical protein
MPNTRDHRHAARYAWAAIVILLFLFIESGQVSAHSFIPKTFDELVSDADHIFHGTVVGKQSRKLPSGMIVSDVEFSIKLELKGRGSDPFTLVMLGGTVGDERVEVAGFPDLVIGREYLLFLKGNGTTILPFVGGDQGLFEIRPNGSGEKSVFGANGKGLPSKVHTAVRPITAGAAVHLDQMVTAIKDRLGAR